jgi:hypothetical protein
VFTEVASVYHEMTSVMKVNLVDRKINVLYDLFIENSILLQS